MSKVDNPEIWQLRFDGGCKGNPGPIASSVSLRIPGLLRLDVSMFVGGKHTNNTAEYHGALFGLFLVSIILSSSSRGLKRKLGNLGIWKEPKILHVYGDSKLVINTASRIWQCNTPHLKPYLDEIHRLKLLLLPLKIFFKHIPRERNKHCDKLVKLRFKDSSPMSVVLTRLDTKEVYEDTDFITDPIKIAFCKKIKNLQ